jgi:hypothetical protein
MRQSTLSDEVDSRLSDIFGDAKPGAAPEPSPEKGEEPLLELRATVLALDWEITDEGMERLIGQAEAIKGLHPEDRHVQTCCQLLISLGKYMKARRGSAHPDTARLVNSVFACLDKVLRSPGLKDQDRNRLVYKEIQSFKRLKEEILKGRQAATVKRGVGVQGPKANPQVDGGGDPKVGLARGSGKTVEPLHGELGQVLSRGLEELRAMVREELDALRQDLKSWLAAGQR